MDARKVTVEQILESPSPLNLDPEFDGACPCSVINGFNFRIDIHCWRTSIYKLDNQRCNCKFSGIHVSGLEKEVAKKVAEHIRANNGWTAHTEWEIVIE